MREFKRAERRKKDRERKAAEERARLRAMPSEWKAFRVLQEEARDIPAPVLEFSDCSGGPTLPAGPNILFWLELAAAFLLLALLCREFL